MFAFAQSAWSGNQTKVADTGIGGADGFHLRRGFSFFHNNAEAAAEEFDQCRDLTILQPPTLVRIAQVYMAVQQPEKALKWVNYAFEKSKSSGKPLSKECELAAYETRSQANHASGKLDQAVADYLRCEQLRPGGDPSVLAKAGDIRTRQKKYDEALKLFDRSIKTSRSYIDPSTYLYKGICLEKMGRTEEAVQTFSKSVSRCQEEIKKNPGTYSITLTNCYVHRAVCYDKLGKTALAKVDRAAHEKVSRSYEDDFFGKH